MEGTVLLLVVGIALVPIVLLIRKQQRKASRVVDEGWEAAAQQLGGSFTPAAGVWYRADSRRLEARVAGFDVLVDHYTVSRGDNDSTTYTRVATRARAPQDFRLKVYRAGALSGLARAIGFQDLEVGDATFDEAFVIKSNDPEAAQLWLNASVRKRIARAEHASFLLDRGRVVVQRSTLVKDATALVALVKAAAALADGRQRVLRAWSKLATKHGGKVESKTERWAALELELDGVPLTLDTRRIGDAHYTVACARVVGARVEPFALARDPHLFPGKLPYADGMDVPAGYELYTQHPEAAVAQLTGPVRTLIDEVEPALVQAQPDSVTVIWKGIALAQREMERAMHLGAQLATGAGLGPYR